MQIRKSRYLYHRLYALKRRWKDRWHADAATAAGAEQQQAGQHNRSYNKQPNGAYELIIKVEP
jgi:hypothetical protein